MRLKAVWLGKLKKNRLFKNKNICSIKKNKTENVSMAQKLDSSYINYRNFLPRSWSSPAVYDNGVT